MTISREQVQQWMNDETTCFIRNKLAEKAKEVSNLNYTLADNIASGNSDYSLEQIGLDSVIRMSTVQGIEAFTDANNLWSLLDFPDEEVNHEEL